MKVELPEIRPEERTPLVETLLAVLRQGLASPDHAAFARNLASRRS